MASANVMKLRGGAAAAILAHNHRHDGRDVEYENEHIDKSLSGRNSVRYWKGVHDPEMTAQGEYQRLRDRVAEIDRKEPPKRIRKDRVTMVGFEVPVPEGLPPEQESRFFSIAYKAFAKMCGGTQNVSTLRIHRDEVHDYLDPVTKDVKTSRVHAHCVGIPYVPGKGVNCKSWMTRAALRDLQADIDRQCRSELGVAFMDGSRQRSRGTVEDLKRCSAQAVTAQEARIAELDAQAAESTQAAQKSRQTGAGGAGYGNLGHGYDGGRGAAQVSAGQDRRPGRSRPAAGRPAGRAEDVAHSQAPGGRRGVRQVRRAYGRHSQRGPAES